MNLCFMTDSLGYMNLDQLLITCKKLGIEGLEFGTGNWSKAPHINLDSLLNDKSSLHDFKNKIQDSGLYIEALNCSGNVLAPNKTGALHRDVVEKTFRLAELLDIKKIVMMSGLPGGCSEDKTPNWITTSWPPENLDILNYQWNEVALPYWEKAAKTAKNHGIEKIALENHGCHLVYNVETLFKLRNNIGDIIGMNLDPSHLFWMGGDPILAARQLGNAIHHVHAKDVRIERGLFDIHGSLDTKTIECYKDRTWNYVALGYGHDINWWKEFFSVLSMMGYDGGVSLEMEDMTMEPLIGVEKSISLLKDSLPKSFN